MMSWEEEEQALQNSTLHISLSLFPSPDEVSPLSGLNILNALFSNSLCLSSSFNVRDQVPYPYRA
jgi:hypothetical protein